MTRDAAELPPNLEFPPVTETPATPGTAEPIRRIRRDNTEFVLLGTAHVSRASAEAVVDMLAAEYYDAVAVELCPHREQALRRPELVRELDLFRVLREGRAGAEQRSGGDQGQRAMELRHGISWGARAAKGCG